MGSVVGNCRHRHQALNPTFDDLTIILQIDILNLDDLILWAPAEDQLMGVTLVMIHAYPRQLSTHFQDLGLSWCVELK